MEGKLIKFKCDTKSGGVVYVFARDKVTASFKCALQFGSCLSAVGVAEKPFDITQHEWSDKLARVMFLPEANKICFEGEIRKPDGIAIAKALGVTAEDLK